MTRPALRLIGSSPAADRLAAALAALLDAPDAPAADLERVATAGCRPRRRPHRGDR